MLRPAKRPRASSQLKSSIWLRRSLSSSFKARSESNALGAGTISEPGYPASATSRSKPSRASSGKKRKRPATRERMARPGSRFSSRQSATSGVSGLGRSSARTRAEGSSAAVREKKGVVTPRRQIGPQATDHRSQRRGLVAEPLGDAVERLVIDEDGTEGLVLALEGLLGLEEEPSDVAPVHDAGSLDVDYFPARNRLERTAKTGAEKGSKRLSVWRGP